MGEVYRARDTKLNRDVAIKVLLPAVANDPDRLARFSREAQVLASLNHPNIAAIYGLEEGPAEAGPHESKAGPRESTDVRAGFSRPVRALVMELVEEKSHGPVAQLRETVEVADGLHARRADYRARPRDQGGMAGKLAQARGDNEEWSGTHRE